MFVTHQSVSVALDTRDIAEILAEKSRQLHVDEFMKVKRSFFYTLSPKVEVGLFVCVIVSFDLFGCRLWSITKPFLLFSKKPNCDALNLTVKPQTR